MYTTTVSDHMARDSCEPGRAVNSCQQAMEKRAPHENSPFPRQSIFQMHCTSRTQFHMRLNL